MSELTPEVEDARPPSMDGAFAGLFYGDAGTRFLQHLVDTELMTIVPAIAGDAAYHRAEGSRTTVLEILQLAGRRLIVSPLEKVPADLPTTTDH